MLRLRFSFCYSQEKKFLEDFIFGFACEINQPNICLQIDFTTLKYVDSGRHADGRNLFYNEIISIKESFLSRKEF